MELCLVNILIMRIPLAAAIALVIVSVLIDIYILCDVRKYSVRRRKAGTWIYGITTLLCWGLQAAILCMPKRSADHSINPLMWMLFSYLSIYIAKIVYCLFSLIGRIFTRRGRFNYGIAAGAVAGSLLFAVLWVGALYTRRVIETTNVEISSARLPKSFDGFRVLQFSDIHVGTWGNDTTFISKLVDSINSSRADVILFTGDIVNRRSSELDPFISVLRRLRAPHGVYAVFGNHDYGGYVEWDEPDGGNRDAARLDSLMKGMGWKTLKNQTDFIRKDNDSIVLIGVENWGDPPFNQLGDLGKSYPEDPNHLKGLNDNMFKILMTHNPAHWASVVKKISNIDLSLSGHTHAMQCMLKAGDWKWSPSQYRYKEWGGLYTDTATDGSPMNLYVNIGAGEVGFPARMGAARPEITVITLRSK